MSCNIIPHTTYNYFTLSFFSIISSTSTKTVYASSLVAISNPYSFPNSNSTKLRVH